MLQSAWVVPLSLALAAAAITVAAQPTPRIKVSLVRNRSEGPAVMAKGGLTDPPGRPRV